jgi:hypothetical protein
MTNGGRRSCGGSSQAGRAGGGLSSGVKASRGTLYRSHVLYPVLINGPTALGVCSEYRSKHAVHVLTVLRTYQYTAGRLRCVQPNKPGPSEQPFPCTMFVSDAVQILGTEQERLGERSRGFVTNVQPIGHHGQHQVRVYRL